MQQDDWLDYGALSPLLRSKKQWARGKEGLNPTLYSDIAHLKIDDCFKMWKTRIEAVGTLEIRNQDESWYL